MTAPAVYTQGNDPLELIINKAHSHGMLLYPCLLVQTPPDPGVRCATWFLEHADEYAIDRHGDLPAGWAGNGKCFGAYGATRGVAP